MSLLTFVGKGWGKLVLKSWDSRVRAKSVPSCSSSQNLQSSESVFSGECLDGAGNDVGLLQPIKDVVVGVAEDCLCKFKDAFKGEEVGEYLRDPWEQLLLLQLVVHDGHFLSLIILELPAVQRVPGEDDDGLGSLGEGKEGDLCANHEHSRVGDFLVACNSVCAICADAVVLHEHHSPPDPVVAED